MDIADQASDREMADREFALAARRARATAEAARALGIRHRAHHRDLHDRRPHGACGDRQGLVRVGRDPPAVDDAVEHVC